MLMLGHLRGKVADFVGCARTKGSEGLDSAMFITFLLLFALVWLQAAISLVLAQLPSDAQHPSDASSSSFPSFRARHPKA